VKWKTLKALKDSFDIKHINNKSKADVYRQPQQIYIKRVIEKYDGV
jgi:6-pyruvoyl-tetrahydropterin synthase